ncbi:MAG: superoxide dismutase [Deltaproteobacteria bacterium]|nr:MAG: superoxide dismutase [Deltaproteobacteria bacterium]
MLKKTTLALILSVLCIAALPTLSLAHCQVPCGIYDDEMRFTILHEDVSTIEKAVAQIKELEGKGTNLNQVVRWILTKDEYAEKIQEMVSSYFLAQRIKFDSQNYEKKLSALHHIIVYAMKCKQSVDPQMVEKLHKAIEEFEKLYLAK